MLEQECDEAEDALVAAMCTHDYSNRRPCQQHHKLNAAAALHTTTITDVSTSSPRPPPTTTTTITSCNATTVTTSTNSDTNSSSSSSMSIVVDLKSQEPLPHGWEQFLHLQTGQVYYIDWRSCRRSNVDPRSRLPVADAAGSDFASDELSSYITSDVIAPATTVPPEENCQMMMHMRGRRAELLPSPKPAEDDEACSSRSEDPRGVLQSTMSARRSSAPAPSPHL